MRYVLHKTVELRIAVTATDFKEAMLLADERPLDEWEQTNVLARNIEIASDTDED